jgi:hypothetical protein
MARHTRFLTVPDWRVQAKDAPRHPQALRQVPISSGCVHRWTEDHQISPLFRTGSFQPGVEFFGRNVDNAFNCWRTPFFHELRRRTAIWRRGSRDGRGSRELHDLVDDCDHGLVAIVGLFGQALQRPSIFRPPVEFLQPVLRRHIDRGNEDRIDARAFAFRALQRRLHLDAVDVLRRKRMA